MTFKEWYYNLQEVGFSTSCIANFSLPIGAGAFTRKWPPSIEDSYYQSPEDQKKSNKRKDK